MPSLQVDAVTAAPSSGVAYTAYTVPANTIFYLTEFSVMVIGIPAHYVAQIIVQHNATPLYRGAQLVTDRKEYYVPIPFAPSDTLSVSVSYATGSVADLCLNFSGWTA